jgi:hypothetical protein
MMGVRNTSLAGLIPRIANLLFYLKQSESNREFFIEASYLEIYNEKLRDLTDKDGTVLYVFVGGRGGTSPFPDPTLPPLPFLTYNARGPPQSPRQSEGPRVSAAGCLRGRTPPRKRE